MPSRRLVCHLDLWTIADVILDLLARLLDQLVAMSHHQDSTLLVGPPLDALGEGEDRVRFRVPLNRLA